MFCDFGLLSQSQSQQVNAKKGKDERTKNLLYLNICCANRNDEMINYFGIFLEIFSEFWSFYQRRLLALGGC